jgi:3-oxoacyl-(acyl-carrier-protein) synthase
MVRVVITGQGTINALGSDVASTVDAMERGQSGISLMDFPNVDRLNVKIGGQIKDFDPKVYFDRQKITFYDRFTQFALIAAQEAILQSGAVGSFALNGTFTLKVSSIENIASTRPRLSNPKSSTDMFNFISDVSNIACSAMIIRTLSFTDTDI